jgi:hypothetical protein
MKAALCTSLAGQTLCVYLYLSTRLIFKTAQLTAQIKTHMHTEQHSIFLYIFPLKMSQHRRRVNKHKGEERARSFYLRWLIVCLSPSVSTEPRLKFYILFCIHTENFRLIDGYARPGDTGKPQISRHLNVAERAAAFLSSFKINRRALF